MFAILSKLASTKIRKPSRSRLSVEPLEDRRVPATLPSPLEQVLLERLNDIRANPAAYGQTIGLDLSQAAPTGPLAFDSNLITAARSYAEQMLATGVHAHQSAQDMTQRVRATGFPLPPNQIGLFESIAYQRPTADIDRVLRDWIVDAQWSDPALGALQYGHRKHLLGMNNDDQLVGVGIAVAANVETDYTIDSATTTDLRPYLTGVVLKDANTNGKYDLNEGVGGIQVRVLQNGAVIGTVSTWSTGGYTMQLNAGTYSVEARDGSGQLVAPVQTVTLNVENVRATFFAVDPTPPPPPEPTGSVIAADRGALGVWKFQESSGWEQVSTLDPLKVAVGSDNSIYASFAGAAGLQRWTADGGWVRLANKPANFVVGANGTILGDYNSNGLYRYTAAAGWQKVSGSDPTVMQIASDGTIISAFAGINGIWKKVGGAGPWVKMTSWNTTGMGLSSDGTLTVDFDARGLWQLSTAGAWTRLTTWDAEGIAVGADGAVAADFGASGVWRWTAAAQWVRLTTANPQAIAMNARGEVLSDEGLGGLWHYFESKGWTRILNADVSGMAIG